MTGIGKKTTETLDRKMKGMGCQQNQWGDEWYGKTTRTLAGRMKGWYVNKDNVWGDEMGWEDYWDYGQEDEMSTKTMHGTKNGMGRKLRGFG
jgi:hypothetical protein